MHHHCTAQQSKLCFFIKFVPIEETAHITKGPLKVFYEKSCEHNITNHILRAFNGNIELDEHFLGGNIISAGVYEVAISCKWFRTKVE